MMNLWTLIMTSLVVSPVLSKLVDLTHYVDENGRSFPTNTKFAYENVIRGPWAVVPEIWLEQEDFRTPTHYGTHVDAPRHMTKDGLTIDEVPLRQLISPAVVVDFTARVKLNPNEEMKVSDLLAWEERHGRIPDKAIILSRTGWSLYYTDSDRYYGVKNPGPANMSFPGISVQAARWLVAERNISAVGSDSLSIDQGNTTSFPSHVVFAKNGILMVENVNLGDQSNLPESGAVVLTMPLKNRGASGSPVRMVAVFGDDIELFYNLLNSGGKVGVGFVGILVGIFVSLLNC